LRVEGLRVEARKAWRKTDRHVDGGVGVEPRKKK